MANEQYDQQQKFYDMGYNNLGAMEFGFPDLKIVEYNRQNSGKKILSNGGSGSDVWYLVDKLA